MLSINIKVSRDLAIVAISYALLDGGMISSIHGFKDAVRKYITEFGLGQMIQHSEETKVFKNTATMIVNKYYNK